MATTGHESEVIDVQGLASAMAKAMNLGISNKGTCGTAADTAAKTVQTGDGFALAADAMVIVTFENAVSTSGATLNVNSTSAKPIYYRGAELGANIVKAGDTLILRYDGTRFDIIGTLDTDTNTVTSVDYDSTGKKLTKTVDGTATDVVTAANIVTDGGGVKGPANSADAHVAVFDGTSGKLIKDSGYTIGKSVPSDALFTDTTYEIKPAASGGTDVSLVTTGEKYNWYNNSRRSDYFTPNGTGWYRIGYVGRKGMFDFNIWLTNNYDRGHYKYVGSSYADSSWRIIQLYGQYSSSYIPKIRLVESSIASIVYIEVYYGDSSANRDVQFKFFYGNPSLTVTKTADTPADPNERVIKEFTGSDTSDGHVVTDTDLTTTLGDYLPLTGGTLTLNSVTDLSIKRSSNSNSLIAFYNVKSNTDTLLGYLGFSSTVDNPVFHSSGGTNYKLWHEGNVGPDSGLNADQLDGLHASDFSRVHTYTLPAGKVIQITFGERYSAIVTGNYGSTSGHRIMLMGVGYSSTASAARNRWLCLDCSSVYSWAKSTTVSRTIEIMNGSASYDCYITVLEMNGVSVTFTQLDAFSQDASVITDKVAMLSSDITGNAATATALQTARTIWGQSFDGTANVSGAISGATTIDATDNITINRNATTVTYVEVKNTRGSIRLEAGSTTAANRGVYDSDTSAWLIYTSSAGNTFLPTGNVGIGTTSPSYKLDVNGTLGVTGDATMTGVLTSDRQRVGVYSTTTSATSLTIRSDRPGTCIYTLSKNVSSVSINSTYNDFAVGERILWILTATAQRTVSIASSETIVTPTGSTLTLTIPANGFVAVLFIYDGSKFFVRPLVDNTVMVTQQTT